MAKGRKAGTAEASEQLSEVLSRIEAMDETLGLAESRLEELEAERAALASRLHENEEELAASRAECARLAQSADAAALAVVRLRTRIEELESELARAQCESAESSAAAAEKLVGEDGGTLEHSPGRQLMLVDRVRRVVDRDAAEHALAERRDAIEDCLAWMVTPSGTLAQIGDAESRSEVVPPGEGGPATAPAAAWRAFPKSGWFAVRTTAADLHQESPSTYLVQICGRHSDRYKHDDDFSFVWFEGSTEILADAGRCRLAEDPTRRYAISTRAHNVATIDERLEERASPKPFGSGLTQCGEGRQLFFSECERRVGDVSHSRVLACRPGLWVSVIDIFHDRTDAEHEYGQRFLLGPELEPNNAGGTLSARVDAERSVHTIPFFEAELAGVWRGQEQPQLEGWCSSAAGELVPATAAKFAKRGSRELLATVFWLGKDKPEPDFELTRTNISARRIRLGWTGDGRRHQIDVVRESGLEVRYRAPSL